MTIENKVTVGATPGPTYATWDEHREAMRRAADESRREGAERKERRHG